MEERCLTGWVGPDSSVVTYLGGGGGVQGGAGGGGGGGSSEISYLSQCLAVNSSHQHLL